MSSSRRPVKISGKVENSKDLKEAFKGSADIVVFDPSAKKVVGSAKLERDAFELSTDIVAENMPSELVVAAVPDAKNATFVKRAIESDSTVAVRLPRPAVGAGGTVTAPTLRPHPGIIERIPSVLFRYVRVCGRVVKKNPQTGEVCPVPGAKVKIYDVDFNFLIWSPAKWKLFSWLYPFKIRKELLAQTVTDACGNFCVFVPRVEIDAIIRWRQRIVCYPDFLLPIRWRHIIEKPRIIGVTPVGPIGPGPGPDPGPVINPGSLVVNPAIGNSRIISAARTMRHMDSPFALRAEAAAEPGMIPDLSATKIFPSELAPPKGITAEILATRITEKPSVEEVLKVKPLLRWRCTLRIEPEISLQLDVPDLAFEVTQIIGGTEKVIHETGLLEIMWDLSGDLNNVELEANELAYCNPLCGSTPHTCTSSGLVGVGVLPINPTFIDPSGNARRANRPWPLVNPANPALGIVADAARTDAKSPFCRELHIFGCPDLEANAKYYKIYYQRDGDPAEHFFTEIWSMWKIDTTEIVAVAPDSSGFYPILTPSDNYYPFHLVLNWPTLGGYPDGRYRLQIELFNAAKASLGRKDNVYLHIDNSAPTILLPDGLQIRGNMGTSQNFTPGVDPDCLVVTRRPGETLTVTARTNVSSTNLRSYNASVSWCRGSDYPDIKDFGTTQPWSSIGTTYWHQDVNDNSVDHVLEFVIPGTAPQGGYSIDVVAWSRAHRALEGLASNWYVDPSYIHRHLQFLFAIINGS